MPRTLLLSAVLIACLAGCAPPHPQVTQGNGPTLVFEAGLGDGAEVWGDLRASLPANVASFAWTRAGYGLGADVLTGKPWRSDLDGKRTGSEVADHLAQTLAEAGQHPPYVLVGHSLGASYALAYAKAHPEQIAGVVLVDPRLPGFTAKCQAEGLSHCHIPLLMLAMLSPTEQAEYRGMDETEAELQDLSVLRNIPITIITATKAGFAEDPRWRAVWAQYADDFAARFTNSRRVSVASGHYIQKEAIGTVDAEILRMLELARSGH